MIKRTVNKPKRTPKNHPVVAFDVETLGDNRAFVHATVIDDNGVYHFNTAKSLRSHLTQDDYAGHNIFAHNLEYDLTMAFEGLKFGITPLYHNNRLIRAKYKPDKGPLINFLDTANFTGRRGLGWLAKVVGMEKWEIPPELVDHGKQSFPWCCIPHKRQYCVWCYCENDTRITYLFARLVQSACTNLGCEIKATVGATGVDLWKRVYLPRNYDVPLAYENRFGRQAYFGGWTENIVIGRVNDVSGYDINSLYPYVQTRFTYPDPNSLHYRYRPSDHSLVIKRPGVSECTVTVPAMSYPPLPVKIAGRLYFPTGTLTGTWTHLDLREAIDRGAKIIEIHHTVYSDHLCQPLGKYMTRLYQFRLDYLQTGNSFEYVVKLLMNALTGKFAQRTDNELYHVRHIDDIDPQNVPKGMVDLSDKMKEYVKIPVPLLKPPDYINTLWAAYMTSYARRELRNWCARAQGTVCYMDTDSIHITGELQTGPELGQLKLEFQERSMVYLGPKFYFSDDDKPNPLSKIRGVPVRKHREFIRKGQVTFKIPTSLGIAKTRGIPLGQWIAITKNDCDRYPKRKPVEHVTAGGNYWNTRPYTLPEIELLLSESDPPPSGWPYHKPQ